MDINSLPFVRSSFTVRRAQGLQSSLPENQRTINMALPRYESDLQSNDRTTAVSSAQIGGTWRVTVHRQSAKLKSVNCPTENAIEPSNKLPAPSKLKKRHSRSEGSIPRVSKRSKSMDIQDHLAQLKRKQHHFDLNSFCDDSINESAGAQQVPGSPELHPWTAACYSDDPMSYGEAVMDSESAASQSWECDSSLSHSDTVESDWGYPLCDQLHEDAYQSHDPVLHLEPYSVPTKDGFGILPDANRSTDAFDEGDEHFAEVVVDISSFSIINYYPREE